MKSISTKFLIVYKAVFIALLTWSSPVFAQNYTYEIKNDTVLDCTHFRFSIWMNANSGTINFNDAQFTLWISQMFVNQGAGTVTVNYLSGSTDVNGFVISAHQYVNSGITGIGAGPDTSIIRLTNLSDACGNFTLGTTPVRWAEFEVVRTDGGCWGCFPTKLGFYIGASGGGKTQSQMGVYNNTTQCTAIIDLPVNGTFLNNNLNNQTPLITAQPGPGSACGATGSAQFSVTAVNVNPGSNGSITYQWLENGIPLSNVAPYSGATTQTLTITGPTVSLNGKNYSCIVIQCDSVTSNAATLTVLSSTSTSTASACSSYVWNGTTYTIAGTYIYHTIGAAGCDSAAILNLTLLSNTGTDSQTACDSYIWHGSTYTTSNNTDVFHTTNVAGSDSAVTLNLTIRHSTGSTDTHTACDSYVWHGTTYTASNNTDVFHTVNVGGCDSVITLHLTIKGSSSSVTSTTSNYSYLWNSTSYTTSGSYTFHTTNAAGCDSAAILNLTINTPVSTYFVQNDTVLDCTHFRFSIYMNATGGPIYYDDSQFSLWISQTFVNGTVAVSYVPGSSDLGGLFNLGGATYASTGITGVGSGGDTSVIRMNNTAVACGAYTLGSTPVRWGEFEVVRTGGGCWGCSPDKLGFYSGVSGGGKTQSNMGSYNNPGQCIPGTIPVAFENYVNSGINSQTPQISSQPNAASACAVGGTAQFSVSAVSVNPGSPGITYQWLENGIPLSNTAPYSGVTTPTLTISGPSFSLNGKNYSCKVSQCGFVISNAASLTVIPTSTSTTNATACSSYVWNGSTYTSSGSFTYHTTSVAGCDSAAILNLSIKNSTSTDPHTACDSYVWNGTTYIASNNTAVFHTTNAAGCDSAVTLNLTINHSTASTDSHTACDSYVWNGSTYTASNNTAVFHTTNSGGCDSTVTLNLTINSSTTSGTSATMCNSYVWNGSTYTVGGDKVYHTTNAAGCDSATTLHLTINSSSTSGSSATACSSYVWNGSTYTTSGDKVFHTTNAAGCDSAATLHLTINSSSTSSSSATACDSYVWNGSTYTASGDKVFHTTNAGGYDSVITLHLTIKGSSSSVTSTTSNYSYLWNSTSYTTSGSYTFHTTNAAGCDSAAILNLTINTPVSTYFVQNDTVLDCTHFRFSIYMNATGGPIYYDDSQFSLWISQTFVNGTVAVSYVPGSSDLGGLFNLGGATYASTGITGVGSGGDTSVIRMNNTAVACGAYTLGSTPVRWGEFEVVRTGGGCWGCSPDKLGFYSGVSGGGKTQSNMGSYNNPGQCIPGTIPVAFENYVNSGINSQTPQISSQPNAASACAVGGTAQFSVSAVSVNPGSPGITYQWLENGIPLSNTAPYSGVTTPTLTISGPSFSLNGKNYSCKVSQCGFVISNAASLTVIPTSTSTTNATACSSYVWNGSTYTSSGSFTYHTTSVAGCDSAAILNLSIKNSTSTDPHTACDSYVWNGTTYIASNNTAVFHTTNAAGSDSAVTLNLTINHSTASTDSHTACDSYVWNGSTYTVGGDKVYHTTNASGCDSTVTLHLSVNHSSSSTDSHTACDSYIWHGTTYTTSNNTAVFHTTNAGGCDSAVTLNLTINHSTTSTDPHTACDSYVWHGTTFTTSNNTAVFHTTNAVGCDSAVTLNLTINHSSSSIDAHTACDSYVWHGTTYASSNNTAVFHTTNAGGCDSAVTLNLVIKRSSSSSVSASSNYSYFWNGTSYTTSGSYTFHTTNSAGCDSAATLNLTINTPTATYYVQNDTVLDCSHFRFSIWMNANGGTINYDNSQFSLWISQAFVNGTATVSYLGGSSVLGSLYTQGSHNYVTNISGVGSGADTAVIQLNNTAVACGSYTLGATPVRLAEFEVVRTGSGCWGCSPNKLGFYSGLPGGGKTQSNMGSYNNTNQCTAAPIAIANEAFVNSSLNNQTPQITSQPIPASACAPGGTAHFSTTAVNANPGSSTVTYQWLENGSPLSNIAPYSGVNTSTLTITNPSNSLNGKNYSCKVTQCGAVTTNAVTLTITGPCTATLTMKMFIEGYYQGFGSATPMDNFGQGGCLYLSGVSADPNEVDTITISLMDPGTQSSVADVKGILQIDGSVSQGGVNSVSLPGYAVGNSYYIRVLHRSAIETWSANPVLINSTLNYDFSVSPDSAFGSNMIWVDNVGGRDVYAFWSGDVYDGVDNLNYAQDGVIEEGDYLLMQNDFTTVLFGYYTTDITGDGVVEESDYLLEQNNFTTVVFKATPW